MTSQEVILFLSEHKKILSDQYGVVHIGLFGSLARDQQKEYNDIDILVELREPKYDWWVGLKIYLEKQLKSKIDLITTGNHLSKRFMKRISKDIIYA